MALLAAAGGSYALLGSNDADAETAAGAAHGGPESFVEVPPMTVNLRTPEGATKFLKVRLVLVAGTATPEEVTSKLPLVLDAFQPFLRELRPDDLTGAAATYRIKEEMLVRANAALGNGAVRDVLVQDLVQQ